MVELAAVHDHAFVALAIAEALGLSDVTAADLPHCVRASSSGQGPMLVVLDNCEQVPGAAPLVAELMALVPTLRFLATSRAPLRVRGERLFPVEPLACDVDPRTATPAELAHVPAIRLFVERARDVQPGFRLTATNAAAVVAICRRLDSLPLALELAAPWMKVLTAEDLLLRLDRDVLLASAGARDLPERQQTMHATIAWSYHLLDERRAFRRFGALPGRFSIDAAAAVLGGGSAEPASPEAIAAAAALIDKSLLHRVDAPGAPRPLYQMLETVRAYAAQTLTAAAERDDALEGLTRYCMREAAGAEEGLIGPAQVEWLDRVRDNLDNFRSVLAWLLEQRRAAEASAIAWGIMFFWLIRGRAAEGLQWYQRALNVPGLPPGPESRAQLGAAVMAYSLGDLAASRARLVRVLDVARPAGDEHVVVQAENLLGHVEQAAGNGEAAGVLFARSVEGFRALGVAWGTGNALIGLAGLSLAAGELARAEQLLDEATAALRPAGPWFLNLPHYLRATVAVRCGDADAAIACVRESLAGSLHLQDRFAFVYALVPLAAAAAQKGDHAWVARILGARDAVTERPGASVANPSVQQLRDTIEAEARAQLGPSRWARAYAAGRTASIDALLRDIDNARQ
jgi:predicted ATPase